MPDPAPTDGLIEALREGYDETRGSHPCPYEGSDCEYHHQAAHVRAWVKERINHVPTQYEPWPGSVLVDLADVRQALGIEGAR